MARICVFCSSSEAIDPSHVELARAVGLELARRGHDLVSGGGRVSMMGAVAEGVRAGGGHTLGVIPQALWDLEVADVDAHELVVTTDMRLRKGHMDAAADAFVVLPGGLGTLEELFEIWTSRTLQMHTKPIVVVDPSGVFEHLRVALTSLADQGFVRARALEAIQWFVEPGAAMDHVEKNLPVDYLPRIDG